ncbi:MAG: LysR family transcriptional regulator [Burkholderiaceae bacterium]|jgi:DNA-binding transcriptional LysR family regulator|nr:LysR family transcriptional regulator [Burkholderiaceae bacterium]
MIQISLRQLEYFVAAARHGSAARAAEAIHVSQPSISKAIADLEAQWGEALFVRRHARGLDLTAAGAARSREAMALLESAQALQGPRSLALAGVLRLGLLSTLGARWVPAILARMRRQHPDITLELVEGDIASLTRQVERGELDAALQYDTGLARPRLDLLPVAALPPYVLLPQRHALAGKAAVGLAEVAAHPLVLIGLPYSREYFLSLFREAGVTPLVAYEFASIEMLRSMVANGHGLGLLTTRPVVDRAHDGQRLACRRIRGRVAPQPVVLAVPRGNASPLLAPFLKAARAVMAP